MTTDRDPRGETPAGVSAVTALTVGWVSYAALAILALGMVSYFANVDVIPAEGVYRWAGIVGMLVSIGAFAGMLGPVLRAPRPSFTSALLVALVAALLHLAAIWVSALIGGGGVAGSTAVASTLILQGGSLSLLLAAFVAAWVAIALRRTRAGRPHWPWEAGADEE